MVQLLELSLQRQGSFSCHIPRKIFRLTLEAWIAALLRWFSQTGNPPRGTLALSRGLPAAVRSAAQPRPHDRGTCADNLELPSCSVSNSSTVTLASPTAGTCPDSGALSMLPRPHETARAAALRHDPREARTPPPAISTEVWKFGVRIILPIKSRMYGRTTEVVLPRNRHWEADGKREKKSPAGAGPRWA